jgi:hypothetical protein
MATSVFAKTLDNIQNSVTHPQKPKFYIELQRWKLKDKNPTYYTTKMEVETDRFQQMVR